MHTALQLFIAVDILELQLKSSNNISIPKASHDRLGDRTEHAQKAMWSGVGHAQLVIVIIGTDVWL